MSEIPTFEGRLYTDAVLLGIFGHWVRRAEVDALLDRIAELEAQLAERDKAIRAARTELRVEEVNPDDCREAVLKILDAALPQPPKEPK